MTQLTSPRCGSWDVLLTNCAPAHIYYVKKHLKQHLDANDLAAAWKFLLPVSTGSRYINELYPEGEELFPVGAHVSKAVKCFKEIMPKSSDDDDDYSYLSEFCHPNLMAFSQHYRWTSPQTIEFLDATSDGASGAITASAIQGLLVLYELLGIGHETDIRTAIADLLRVLAK
jgi:hypothetical protein